MACSTASERFSLRPASACRRRERRLRDGFGQRGGRDGEGCGDVW
jgi:hypothetical protein